MITRSLNQTQRTALFSILLLALFVRALVPAGFMPSSEQPFSFQICPDGFPTQLLHSSADEHAAHHHHAVGQPDDGAQHSGNGPHEHGVRAEHCVFAAAATVAAATQIALLLTPLEQQAAPHFYYALPTPELTRHRVQQPRAPPALS